MDKKKKKIKLSDIARLAQVSTATVSRLVGGRGKVNPETRDRVIEAALRLGFDLDRGRKSRIIAFLLSNRGVLHPFHSAVLMGAEAYCAEHDYALLFLPFQYSLNAGEAELVLPEILLERKIISGVIVAGTNSEPLLELLASKAIPWVVLGNNVLSRQADSPGARGHVYFDDVTGAYEMTQYLKSMGHREIAFVGNLNLPWYARRYKGYKKAMVEGRLKPLASDLNAREGEEMGYLAAKLMLQQERVPTAIFAGDDASACGVYKAARDLGFKIPEDLSVAGFNDTPEASALHPPLTSVRVFTDELGKQLAEVLLKRIVRPDLQVRDLNLPTQLVRRESCAVPAARQINSIQAGMAQEFAD